MSVGQSTFLNFLGQNTEPQIAPTEYDCNHGSQIVPENYKLQYKECMKAKKNSAMVSNVNRPTSTQDVHKKRACTSFLCIQRIHPFYKDTQAITCDLAEDTSPLNMINNDLT